MVAIKIPSNPCDTNQKTLKRILRKIHKKNDTRKNYFKSTSKALELVKRQEGHSINCINKLSKSTLTHKHVIPRHVVQVWHLYCCSSSGVIRRICRLGLHHACHHTRLAGWSAAAITHGV